MSTFNATVSSVTRRYAEICDGSFNLTLAKVASRDLDICIGDHVECELQKGETMVIGLKPRQNIINRSYQGKTKDIVANTDHLYIVTAVGPLLNTIFLDRILALAHLRNISSSIILNKIDKEEELAGANEILECYRRINIPVIPISVKKEQGLESLRSEFLKDSHKTIALCGVSGAGKSSLINKFIPEATARIDAVSKRTGQGKQTTTQAIAYPFPSSAPRMLLVDTPGLQNFGISHLSELEAKDSFVEFGSNCRFQDCRHISEPGCLVQERIKSGEIAQSRYESYLGMIEEIKSVKHY
jgi:ribosome biogenesis GTPase